MAKLSRELMDDLIFDKEIQDENVVMGPAYGEDAAVVDLGDFYMVAHSDPISGAIDNIGWLALNIAANDIAVSGASPRWALLTTQFPIDHPKDEIREVMLDLYDASRDLDIDIVGGHSEMIEQIDHPLITTALLGITKRPIYTKGSEPGDKIVQIDEAALEGTWILASDFYMELERKGVDSKVLEEAKSLRDEISVVDSALKIKDKVSSMHDPTEGGVLQGLYEMAHASENEFIIDSTPELKEISVEICDKLSLDPFRLISSGCLLATVPDFIDLEIGKVIGEVRDGEPSVIFEGEKIDPIEEDELFRTIRSLS
ncbi:MAG: hydrogenase assembly protein HupF [Candidatus Thermoplasmatota archaeon]|nr:hydrogenase assembly protein HupF [Candidatus Thermoplasmatota archaeon]MBS3789688.1 hydrogenase assembly protein HupF [Candidatus Thermoplasmatota archaeon]